MHTYPKLSKRIKYCKNMIVGIENYQQYYLLYPKLLKNIQKQINHIFFIRAWGEGTISLIEGVGGMRLVPLTSIKPSIYTHSQPFARSAFLGSDGLDVKYFQSISMFFNIFGWKNRPIAACSQCQDCQNMSTSSMPTMIHPIAYLHDAALEPDGMVWYGMVLYGIA